MAQRDAYKQRSEQGINDGAISLRKMMQMNPTKKAAHLLCPPVPKHAAKEIKL